MSRLDEIKEWCVNKEIQMYERGIVVMSEIDLSNIRNLIQQAESNKHLLEQIDRTQEINDGMRGRVEELEEHARVLESSVDQETKHNIYLHKKNRRYKQALEELEKIRYSVTCTPEEIGRIIDKAFKEGESE